MSDFSIEKVEEITAKYFGIEASAAKLVGYEDLNFLLETPDGKRFVLKLYHTGESWENLAAQNQMLLHLSTKNHDLDLPHIVPNLEGEHTSILKTEDGTERHLRLLTWVEGRLYAKVSPHSPALRKSMGKALGQLCRGLADFDHPAAHRYFIWDNAQVGWVGEKIHLIAAGKQQDLAEHFFKLIEKEALPKLKHLRKSVIQGDANDLNVTVSKDRENPTVTGLFDFGDLIFSPTINELAVSIAYMTMHQPDPLMAAAEVVRGMHAVFPLEEAELEILYHLIAARLLISLTSSAIGRHQNPDNEYIQVSEKPGWELLKKWRKIPPQLAHFTFRWACGFEPCPNAKTFRKLVASGKLNLASPVNLKGTKPIPLDLSVGSLDLGGYDNFATNDKFEKTINAMLPEGSVGIGGYGEVRPFYSTDAYRVMGNDGPQWRTVHLGLDIWAPARTPVLAPHDATVFSVKNNAGERDYGPTIILEHEKGKLKFYTLHGHLSLASLANLAVGKKIKKGEPFAEMGPAPENGNWPPHLHYQVILDLLGNEGDFPGVAFPHEREVWMSVCPSSPSPSPLNPPKGDFASSEGSVSPRFSFGASGSNTFSEGEASCAKSPFGGFRGLGLGLGLLPRRRKHLPKNLSLSYRKPLTMLRGAGQYLFDKTGRRYLDTVNNVAHVGHEHPAVVRAAARQNAVLNTNTRYLHPNIIRFAERLTATLPAPLDVAFFVNSGSEANELALRIARTVTGRHGVLAMEHGYHGNTGACVEVSQYKFGGPGGHEKPSWLDLVPPNHQSPVASRHKACFLHETILSCAGQVVLPDGFLKNIYGKTRAAGGLCIADEVQTGVGRMGDFWWAFETQNVVPDIVTIGKPIGNGHPLGAVVTTREIADAFANGMEYFNTFGGNPVSCAVGLEVLRTVEEDGLRQNASEVGAYLMEGLRNLAERHPIIADVRGHGLFLGYELLHPESGEAMAAQTSYLANRLRDLGVLASTDGPLHNVIKIKPPMVFNRSNADFLLEMTERVLWEDFMRV